jgi:hypothetical protein
LQDIAVERGLGKREIVKGPKRHRIGWCVRVDSAQQEPCEQREQQEHPEGTRQEFSGQRRGCARGGGGRPDRLTFVGAGQRVEKGNEFDRLGRPRHRPARPCSSDQLHMNDRGYGCIAKLLASSIAETLISRH